MSKIAPPPTAGDFIDTACALAGDISPDVRSAIAATWPADAPHAAVVAHLLAVMLVDVRAAVSSGFIRAKHQPAPLPPKPPAPHVT
jgi:hypothetical protein